ncbi:flavin mononucleotide reductase YcdH [Acetobacter estunensis NRIC 0472]|uniref:FMN reductase n=1 Tax=Acetobacter estunensis TaxID=104097 RepID=A0A967B5B1_9PROT|nr:flavin reductase [Acetobacter estunensis]NHO53504.1 FMN reductase [Acetobacter estunensis]GBQ28875.1 flavin mononucleotide reductase YcdH [Acetobacter estunensis NRIC 0472]
MARLGAAVTVVTTGSLAQPVGFTASAVCSVTDDPPTVLVCLKRSSRVRPSFVEGAAMCVNVLAANQEELSNRFAGPLSAVERFAAGHWETLMTGAPVLNEAVVSLDCRISRLVEEGTHTVMFGRVQALRLGATAHGLVYFNRSYHRLPYVEAFDGVTDN